MHRQRKDKQTDWRKKGGGKTDRHQDLIRDKIRIPWICQSDSRKIQKHVLTSMAHFQILNCFWINNQRIKWFCKLVCILQYRLSQIPFDLFFPVLVSKKKKTRKSHLLGKSGHQYSFPRSLNDRYQGESRWSERAFVQKHCFDILNCLLF